MYFIISGLIRKYENSVSHITSVGFNPVNVHTFMASSYDGIVWVYDIRVEAPVKKVTIHDAPPWCLSASWLK